jgi:hypothetical protein
VTNSLGPDPTATVTFASGLATLRLLTITLAVTPARRAFAATQLAGQLLAAACCLPFFHGTLQHPSLRLLRRTRELCDVTRLYACLQHRGQSSEQKPIRAAAGRPSPDNFRNPATTTIQHPPHISQRGGQRFDPAQLHQRINHLRHEGQTGRHFCVTLCVVTPSMCTQNRPLSLSHRQRVQSVSLRV